MASRKLTAVDLFCGAGGLSEGLRAAGYEIPFAVDLDPTACETYRLNHPDTHVECAPITAIRAVDIARVAGKYIDLVAGGPSCQGFSSAGRKLDGKRGWVRAGDDRNALWRHQFEIVQQLKPRAFLLENVPGFMSFEAGAFGATVVEEFRALGYQVSAEILLAADYGVPQLRRRLFIVGIMKGRFRFPERTHLGGWRRDTLERWDVARGDQGLRRHISCWEAIADLPRLPASSGKPKYSGKARSRFAELMRGDGALLTAHEVLPLSDAHLDLIRHVPPGGTWRDIPPHLLPDRFRGMRRTDSTNLLGRLDPQRPAYTITTQFNNVTTGCNTHPYEDRSLSVREGARLQSFPDSYRFQGAISAKCRQIGNAVPPRLAHLLGVAIGETLAPRRSTAKVVAAPPVPPAVKRPAARPASASPSSADSVSLSGVLTMQGARHSTNERPLPDLDRAADLLFREERVAVLVNDCFMYGCPSHARHTKSRTKWWAERIAAHKKAEGRAQRVLKAAGWTVVQVWEHEHPHDAAERVSSVLEVSGHRA